MPTQIIHHLHYRWLPYYKKTPADRMPSLDTKFIYDQPSALVKNVFGVLKAANYWLTADGENDAHTGICTLHETPNTRNQRHENQ